MKKTLLLSLLPLYLSVAGQVMFDFEDSTVNGWIFNQPGRWIAGSVSPLSGVYSLYHSYDNAGASADAAMFSIAGLCPLCSEVRWMFTLRHATDPSSSNRWSFLLMSDAGPADIAGGNSYSGYAVGVNLTGYDDTLRLWHVSGGKADVVVTTAVNWQQDVGSPGVATIIVTRRTDGRWTVEASWSTSTQPEGGPQGQNGRHGTWEGFNEALHTPAYAGVLYVYTATRDRLLWIDDVMVQGVFIHDTEPPVPVSVTALRANLLQIIMDEEADLSFVTEGNITLEGGLTIREVKRSTPTVYQLHLDGLILNRHPEVLHIGNLCDLAGNCITDLSLSFIPVYAVTGDIVISEIMADPTPSHGLPESEYLEITNRTGDSLFTGGMFLIAGRDTVFLPARWVRSEERIILCSAANEKAFLQYGHVMALSSLPSLNDDGEVLVLRDGCRTLIHAVHYIPAFLGDGARSGGGWSAELTDLDTPFNEPEAWSPSSDPSGGTPGRVNSIEKTAIDYSCPQVVAIWPLSTDTIAVLFDETIMFSGGGAWLADGRETYPAVSGDPADHLVLIRLHDALAPGTVCSVIIPSHVTDFAGNVPSTTELRTGIATDPMMGDILFNELLPDPADGCVEYIELYNNSGRIFDLSRLSIANSYSTVATPPTKIPRQLLPGSYVALTQDRGKVLDHYPCADGLSLYVADRLPALRNDKGTVVLYDRSLNIIDRVDYSDDMHLLFLTGTKGVALEKVSPSLSSDVPGNWHSASEACGWGTPGAPNSVTVTISEEAKGLTLSSSRVSPDGDGYEDVISVNIFPGGEGNVISVTVFNDRGYPVRRLAERFAAGSGAHFIWDGTTDSGSRLPAGLYMIIAESYNAAGSSGRWKAVCALLYR